MKKTGDRWRERCRILPSEIDVPVGAHGVRHSQPLDHGHDGSYPINGQSIVRVTASRNARVPPATFAYWELRRKALTPRSPPAG